MALSDISLTAGMRSNLLQLQNTSRNIDRTQERLSTGKQVNSALDNPTNFFASQAALNRANDFSSRKDGMGEAIQNVKAADAGITAITSLVTAAKGLAEAALGTTSTTDRAAFATQYTTLQTQITQLASDSGYRGTNLLGTANNTLTVNFNEDASSKIVVTGDVTQVDLPPGQMSGLLAVEQVLKDVSDLSFIRLSAKDVVRHRLVQRIVEAYSLYEERVKG